MLSTKAKESARTKSGMSFSTQSILTPEASAFARALSRRYFVLCSANDDCCSEGPCIFNSSPQSASYAETQPYVHHPRKPFNFNSTPGDRDGGFATLNANTGGHPGLRGPPRTYKSPSPAWRKTTLSLRGTRLVPRNGLLFRNRIREE